MPIQRVLDYDCFFCDKCRTYVYNELAGQACQGIAPRTRVDDLPESWSCPMCGADKYSLRAVTLLDDFNWPTDGQYTAIVMPQEAAEISSNLTKHSASSP